MEVYKTFGSLAQLGYFCVIMYKLIDFMRWELGTIGQQFYKKKLKNLVILKIIPIPSQIDLNLKQNLFIPLKFDRAKNA